MIETPCRHCGQYGACCFCSHWWHAALAGNTVFIFQDHHQLLIRSIACCIQCNHPTLNEDAGQLILFCSNGRVASQGSALNRGVLSQSVIEAHAARTSLHGNILFGKHGCPHCKRARKYLDQAHMTYDYRDVIK